MSRRALYSVLFLFAGAAQAQLHIVVTGTGSGATPLAVVPFGVEAGAAGDPEVRRIVVADLERTGRFRVVDEAALPQRPQRAADIRFELWRGGEAGHLVIGRFLPAAAGRSALGVQVFDVYTGRQLAGQRLEVPEGRWRALAHAAADVIYEALTGEPGAFSTRIAYIVVVGEGRDREWRLEVADADGADPRILLRSKRPILSPAFAPDGRRLAYVSFENDRSEIYLQWIYEGRRERIAAHEGINGAPAFAPDGRRLAYAASHEGNSELYLLDLDTGRSERLTRDSAIDTEPSWFPDGRSLAFASGRAGGAQIYRLDLADRRVRRLTFEGTYNASPDVSPDGRTLVFVHGEGGAFRIAALDLASGTMRRLTDGRLDESPSFAPNGAMVLYATQAEGRGVLAAAALHGGARQRLAVREGQVREPAWGPLNRPAR